MSRLLVICHSPSDNARLLRDAVLRGAESFERVQLICHAPLETDHQPVLEADAVLLGTTENFGYMSGALKDFFDRIYYPCLDQTQGLPFAQFIKAGMDGQGAVTSIRRIVQGLRWREVQEPTICIGPPGPEHLLAFEELGATLAAGLDAGLF